MLAHVVNIGFDPAHELAGSIQVDGRKMLSGQQPFCDLQYSLDTRIVVHTTAAMAVGGHVVGLV